MNYARKMFFYFTHSGNTLMRMKKLLKDDDDDDEKTPDIPAISYDIEEYTDYKEDKDKDDEYTDEQINPKTQGEPYS